MGQRLSEQLNLTAAEAEMLETLIDPRTGGFPKYMTFPQLMDELEKLITRQESDQGDWLRAKEYRAAKASLLQKLRVHQLRSVE